MTIRDTRLNIVLTLLLLGCLATRLHAQQDTGSLTGDLQRDVESLPIFRMENNLWGSGLVHEPAENATEKSLWLAGGLSALLPGAGQIYAEAPWWRAVLYGALEVAGWTTYAVYTAKGDQATADFLSFADEHWDVTRYISWVEANYMKWGDDEVIKSEVEQALAAIYISNDPALPGWQRVDFDQLNRLERAVKGGFSHTLPRHGEQQYYEEIGKYVQYRAGWDDHNAVGDSAIYNPGRVSGRNTDYTLQRERANDLLGIAEAGIGIVILNHLASMLDAAFEARGYNIRLRAGLKGEMLHQRRMIPLARLEMTVRF